MCRFYENKVGFPLHKLLEWVRQKAEGGFRGWFWCLNLKMNLCVGENTVFFLYCRLKIIRFFFMSFLSNFFYQSTFHNNLVSGFIHPSKFHILHIIGAYFFLLIKIGKYRKLNFLFDTLILDVNITHITHFYWRFPFIQK